MPHNLENHPCFNAPARHEHGRVHLPVAPKCNIQCNFCNRKYDCANESRPGVTSTILTPGQAMVYLEHVVEADPRISVVGIAGPGDPFANPVETMEILRRVRARYPEMLLCVATNGLEVAPHVEALAGLDVSHVTITLTTLEPGRAAKIYAWVRDNKRVLRGLQAGELLIKRQLEAIRALKDAGIIVKVNTIIIPGVNDENALEVAEAMGKMGVDILNLLPLYPVEGSAFESLPEPTKEETGRLRAAASEFVPQMLHCGRCRADAAGLLSEGIPKTLDFLSACASLPAEPGDTRTRVAVATMEGVLVNLHLGEAKSLAVFGRVDGAWHLVEHREVPAPGGGERRWQELGERFEDCSAILVNGAGGQPKAILEKAGIRLIVTEGLIEPLLDMYCRGKPLPSAGPAMPCGTGCTGSGTGCG
jgi:nitrogen fixation protein NifB